MLSAVRIGAARASRVLGGPLGRHAVCWSALVRDAAAGVLLLATITLTLGWLAKAPWPQTYRGSVAFGGRWVGCRLDAYDKGGLHEKSRSASAVL
ncbi:MAG TPA: hypothetical protein VGL46_15120 [Pseudonocardiaceae bacterium]